jgi:hypothetical protein
MSVPTTSDATRERGLSWTGRCLCGEIEYAVNGAPVTPSLCHCTQCRLSAGASPVAWVSFPRASFEIRSGQPRWYQSSPPARRGFCGSCGASLFFETDEEPDLVDITTATLDRVDEIAPTNHIWVDSKLAWVRIDDGLPAHARDRTHG